MARRLAALTAPVLVRRLHAHQRGQVDLGGELVRLRPGVADEALRVQLLSYPHRLLRVDVQLARRHLLQLLPPARGGTRETPIIRTRRKIIIITTRAIRQSSSVAGYLIGGTDGLLFITSSQGQYSK